METDPSTGLARYRLLLADDHALCREYIRNLVSPQHDVVGEVGDGDAVAGSVRDLHPDILLLDVSMPHVSGFGVLRRLSREGLHVAVVMVTHHRDPRYLQEARHAGAAGYVLKSSLASDLLPAIRQIGQGGSYLPASL